MRLRWLGFIRQVPRIAALHELADNVLGHGMTLLLV
jgi:hypothetical protein